MVPEIFKTLSDVDDIEKFMESHNFEYLPHDVYVGLRDILYIKKCGYLDLISHILKKNYGTRLTNEIDAIVLQINESQRWQSRYHSTDKQYDLVLGIPEWSRVVALSTSDIEPSSLIKRINQFDTIHIQNYHFYEMFNKLHGVNGRNVTLVENTPDEKARTFSRLNFLFRTSEDVEIISHSRNLRLFTLIPDINGIARVGFYFSMVGRVTKIEDVLKKDGTGIDPYSYTVQISDDFSTLQMNLTSDNFVRSARKLYLANEINRFFGSIHDVSHKFEHPSEMVDYDGYVLLMGMWFLGDDFPGISYIIPLNKDINYLKYQILGFMNTRKKQSFQSVRDRWRNNLESTENNGNLKKDSLEKWIFFKEEFWDEKIFQLMVEKKFEKIEFHDIISHNISFHNYKKWIEYTTTYFKINDFIKKLYISDTPEMEFELAYARLESIEHDEETLTKFAIEAKQVPSLGTVISWTKIKAMIPAVKNGGYSVEEIFSWGNGGKKLQKKMEKMSYYEKSGDEVFAAIYNIYQARGEILLPEEIIAEQ